MTDRSPAPQGATVLLVEDDEGVALPLRCSLEREGHQVERVTSGRDALTRLRRGPVSLLVLDLELPDMDGAVLAHQVHREGLTPAMIMLTPGLGRLPVTRQHEGTVVSCIAKPFAVREFLARTRSLLRRTQPGQVPQNVV